MTARTLLGVALLSCAATAAACADDTDALTNGGARQPTRSGTSSSGGGGDGTASSSGAPGTSSSGGTPSGPVATNSPAGKEFFKSNVFPFMSSKCGACHGAAGPGPAWITMTDAEASYAQLFQVGYVIQQSRVTQKPAHGGVTTNVLSPTEIATYNQWVEMELKDGGQQAPPNILEKLGSCFDRTKFDAMKLGEWRTTRRTDNNNTNNVTPWNENANNCTGCNNAPCTTCHSADAATNFKNAVGNPLLPADNTFEESKLTQPAYITKYFGVSPDGKPIASDALKKKSDATKKDKAYTHPMYSLTTEQQTALDAFVADVITKYTAGTCGK